MAIDRKSFFDAIRKQPFGGRLNAGQVEGVSAILDEWDRRALTDLRWLAYMLAIAKWETRHTMQPIREDGGAAYFKRMYDIAGDRPALARKHGNINSGDGARYCGRGLVQLTWRDNYRRMGQILGLPLERSPELALQMDHAVAIMFEGMLRADSSVGDFTGKCLEDYFNDATDDPVGARRIINGTDKAVEIAAIHRQFLAALEAAHVPDRPAPQPQDDDEFHPPLPRRRPRDFDTGDNIPSKKPWYKRAWARITGGVGAGGVLSYLTDPWVVVALAIVLGIFAAIFVWFMGPQKVRGWISRQLNS